MKPNHSSLTGSIQNVFAHRFTLQTSEGVVLADLTPHGGDKINLAVGDKVTIEGERKPLAGAEAVCIGLGRDDRNRRWQRVARSRR
jgi:hypothetical protein